MDKQNIENTKITETINNQISKSLEHLQNNYTYFMKHFSKVDKIYNEMLDLFSKESVSLTSEHFEKLKFYFQNAVILHSAQLHITYLDAITDCLNALNIKEQSSVDIVEKIGK